MQDDTIRGEVIAQMYDALAASAYMAWMSNAIGSPPPATKTRYAFFKAPEVGALVMEVSTYHRRASHADAIGTLERIAQEPAYAPDEWDEAEEGRPVPLERVYYIRTLSGREHRWVNAEFVRVLRNDRERRDADL